ncbi:MAG: hypothetical protein IPL10_14705 [Bacteroidetes bacterium]|nr:hypothetical protein [Bacteroidota bacterium]
MTLLILVFSIVLLIVVIQPYNNIHNEKPNTTYKLNPDRDKNNWWHCPDNYKGFPALSIKNWNKAPALNRRLPTFKEAGDGTSLIYYEPNVYPDAKAYDMDLPRLASFANPYTNKVDTVIVIQVVQTDLDTIVGYRYLTGGNGTYNFKSFHFLTDEEVKKAVEKNFIE